MPLQQQNRNYDLQNSYYKKVSDKFRNNIYYSKPKSIIIIQTKLSTSCN